jgi:glycosyltransferase involved in cell wall biosynthesis
MDQAELERRFLAQTEFLGEHKPVNETRPLVSACVVTYQHARFIGRCLDSILAQRTSFPFEIVIGEDESTDGTREICMEYARRHPDRIRLFLRSRASSSVVAHELTTRLNGMWTRRAARGTYVALCEGDDYWTDPDKLQKQAGFLDAHPECAMCFHNALLTFEDGSEPPRLSYRPEETRPFYDLRDLLKENFIQTASIFYRRSALAYPLPSWWYRMTVGDWTLLLLVAQSGLIGYLPETMSVYRLHEGGIWGLTGRRRQLEKTARALEVILTEFAAKLPDAANARAIVHRSAFDTYVELGDRRNALRHARKVPGYAAGYWIRNRTSSLAAIGRARWPSLWNVVRRPKTPRG